MKSARLLRWSGSVISTRTSALQRLPSSSSYHSLSSVLIHPVQSPSSSTPSTIIHRPCRQPSQRRSLATAAVEEDIETDTIDADILLKLPSPPITAAATSPSLAALHARLLLTKVPIETLARTLVHPTADPDPLFNNASLSKLGADLLSFYTSEYILCQFPRLPLAVVFAAMNAYCGPKALSAIRREWGVHPAAAPGGEVDPAYLQLRHGENAEETSTITTRPMVDGVMRTRHSLSNRTVRDDEFGNRHTTPSDAVGMDEASAAFVRAVMGAVYVHAGRSAAKKFYKDHFMSRQLNVGSLMSFRTPTRDLAKLCAREGFESPVARILSETGRRSRSPVFIVGVFSGQEKLGEGAGASLDEARTRAAVAALKGWYLYSPLDWRLPSDAEEAGSGVWQPQHVDVGDVVI